MMVHNPSARRPCGPCALTSRRANDKLARAAGRGRNGRRPGRVQARYRVGGDRALKRTSTAIGVVVVGVLASGSSSPAGLDRVASVSTTAAPRGEAPTVTTSPPTDLASPPAVRAPAVSKPVARRDASKNEITQVSAESLSGQAMRVTIDYAYAGDYGTEDVFLHAAALRDYFHGQGLRGRVPGTGFPGEAVAVGNGRVTLTINRVVEGDALTSTAVRVCLVSLPRRAAFLCRNFAHTKEWD
jgi:hypothetical protein